MEHFYHFFKNSSKKLKKLKSLLILYYVLQEIDKIFTKTIVLDGLRYGGKHKSVAHLVKDVEI